MMIKWCCGLLSLFLISCAFDYESAKGICILHDTQHSWQQDITIEGLTYHECQYQLIGRGGWVAFWSEYEEDDRGEVIE